jgi:transposase-like protein
MARLPGVDELFEGRHFDREIIVLCVRWYLRFKLSFRDLVEMMAERGLSMAHTTIMRWVHHYAPEFERRWNQFARSVGPSWRVDETYVKIRGKWVYLYRAVDRDGKTVDFRLSTRRDVTAAKAFFCKAIKVQGAPPRTITLDGYAASHRAVRDMQAGGQLPADTKLRSSKYLNCVMLRFALRVAARLVSPASGVARSPVIGHMIANTRRVVPRRRRGADCRVLSITCRRALSKMG